MLTLIIVVFLIAAILGMLLISYLLRNKNTPKGLAIIHGSIAAFGILLLICYLLFYSTSPYLSLIFFIIAAIGGFTLMYRDITGKTLPKWLAIGHGTIAVIGFLLLLLVAFSLL